MKSFIMITFGLLGFAFYEISGGADFDADALRSSRVEAGPIDSASETQIAEAKAPVVEPAQANPVLAAAVSEPEFETVSRSNLTLASLESPSSDNRVSATFSTGSVVSSSDLIQAPSAIILPSLIASNDKVEAVVSATQSAQEAEIQAITRTVSANRVNVRGGPGTNYGVVNKLIKGQEVEIIADPGNGWVKMRAVQGGSVGWLADFLLTES